MHLKSLMFWTLLLKLKRSLEAAEKFYGRRLEIAWTEHVCNEDALEKMETQRTLIVKS